MRRILTLIIAAGLGAALIASAASLSVTGAAIQAGGDHSLKCDQDGVGVNWGLEASDQTVRTVRVAGIDDACLGAELGGVVTTTGQQIDLGHVQISGSQVTFTLSSPYPNARDILGIDLVLEGPNVP